MPSFRLSDFFSGRHATLMPSKISLVISLSDTADFRLPIGLHSLCLLAPYVVIENVLTKGIEPFTLTI